MIAWLRIVSNLGAILVLALVLVRYLNMVVPLPTKPAMFGIFLLFWGVNMVGVGLAGRLQVLMIAAMIGLFLLFAAWGAPTMWPAPSCSFPTRTTVLLPGKRCMYAAGPA